MIRIAICDDDIQVLDNIRRMTASFSERHPQYDCSIRSFHSVYDLLESMESGNIQFHIYLLDVMMPLIDGIEVGKQIRKSDDQAIIIYMTSSPDFALTSFQVMPLQYLLKPISQEHIDNVLIVACTRIQQAMDANILVQAKDSLVYLRYHQIIYMEYIKHAVIIHVQIGEPISTKVMRQSFSNFTEKYLQDDRFVKPHASYLVNMDHVYKITPKQFILINGKSIPISRRIYASVVKQFMDYALKKNTCLVK